MHDPLAALSPTRAKLDGVKQITPTVKGFRLKVDPAFTFSAGQWVDVYPPVKAPCTGFSITTTPSFLKKTGCIELAVKRTSHSTTRWFHDHARVGNTLEIRVGGQLVYRPSARSLLAIAGGIGITPLWSILQHLAEVSPKQHAMLLYSAKSTAEFVFRKEIVKWAAPSQRQCFFTVTGPDETGLRRGRIDSAWLRSRLEPWSPDYPHVYLCGPGSMMHHLRAVLEGIGTPPNAIFQEDWGTW